MQDQKDELTVRIDGRIRKVPKLRVRLEAAPAAAQQSVGRRVWGRDRREGGARRRGESGFEATERRASDGSLTSSLGGPGSDGRNREEAAT